MGARVDSDEDGGGKAISKKETRMLLAINSAESILIDAMTQDMLKHDRSFDIEKFVEVFRKYTPHFVQMLSAESSDDSDEEDERPLPKKHLPYLAAFAKARDEFVAAIEKNYKILCKKDLKDINFSVFKSHPEEIFKSYGNCSGGPMQSRSSSPHQLQLTTHNVFGAVRIEGEMEYALHTININDSVDTDHGSLLSCQEEELRKTIESESDTPTPTIEDWNGVKESRKSMERTIDLKKSRPAVPDAVPLMVPPTGQNENCRLDEVSTFPSMNPIRREVDHLLVVGTQEDTVGVERKTALTQQTDGHAIPIHSSNTLHDSTSTQRNDFYPIMSPTGNAYAGSMLTTSPLIPHSQSYGSSNTSKYIPSVISQASNVEEEKREDTHHEEFLMTVMDELKDSMEKVHQDVRFALPPMIERVVRTHIKENRPVTIGEFIGEYADDRLEKFMVKMLSKDKFLMMMLELKFSNTGATMIHLRPTILLRLKEYTKSKMNEKPVEECGMEQNIVRSSPTALNSITRYQFYPQASNLPMPPLMNARNDVSMPYNGTFAVVLSKWAPVVDAQLEGLRHLEIDHLNLSSERYLEKGRAVVLKSDVGTYCRGIIHEDWMRDSMDGKATEVKCLLIDYGEVHKIPIEAIYAFPKWTETIPPALILIAKLEVYPREAALETDSFSEIDWRNIAQVLSEWKKDDMRIHILSREEDKYVIDLENDKGESFTDVLVKTGLVKKELTSTAIHSSSHSLTSSDEHSSSIAPSLLPLNSEGGLVYEQNLFGRRSSSPPSMERDDATISVHLPSYHNPQIDEPSFEKIDRSESRGESRTTIVELGGDDSCPSCPTIPSSMNVFNRSAITSPSLILRSEEPKRRDFLEIPSSTGIPSLLQFVPQPALSSPPPQVIGLNIRRSVLVQVLDDNE